MKKYIFFILLLINMVCISSAQMNTTDNNTSIIPYEEVSQKFYGTAVYIDGKPVEPGSIVTAKDQYGNILGNYTIRFPGLYGDNKPHGEGMDVAFVRNTDRYNISKIIMITFYINGVPSRNYADFKPGETTEFNIFLPIAKPTPTQTTIIPTLIITENTPVPTVIPLSNNTTIYQPIIITPQQPIEDNRVIIYYGIIVTIIVILAIVICGIIMVWLMNKTSRDDVIKP